MFYWITKHHEIVVGFKQVHYSICRKYGKCISEGDSLCDARFSKDRNFSKK
jgi:hypothetical protein